MANTYRALAVMLSYPTAEIAALVPPAMAALAVGGIVPMALVRGLAPLARELEQDDLYEAQARYVDLFDRTRSLVAAALRAHPRREPRPWPGHGRVVEALFVTRS